MSTDLPEASQETFFYSVLSDTCSCRDEYGELSKIGHKYKIYYSAIASGDDPIDVLKRLKIQRMCCRSRFLSIPIVPMIERSKDRIMDLVTNNNQDTKPIYPTRKNEFPIIHDKKVRKPNNGINIVSKFKVVPPSVDAKGSLPEGF